MHIRVSAHAVEQTSVVNLSTFDVHHEVAVRWSLALHSLQELRHMRVARLR